MSSATGTSEVRRDHGQKVIAETLREQWRVISSVSLRPCKDGDGYEADLRLDPIVVKGSLKQQGYPGTPEGFARIEIRRNAALDGCVQRVNRDLEPDEQIKRFSIVD